MRQITGLSPHIEPVNVIGRETTVVQEFWNVLENIIVTVTDDVAPLCPPHVNKSKPRVNQVTKNLINNLFDYN